MVRAEFFMKTGDEEIKKEIKDCDLIVAVGLEYKEVGAGMYTAVQGEANELTAQALAKGMINILKKTGKSRAEKTVNMVRFRETFDALAKGEIYKMMLEESREGEDEEGEEEDGEIPV